MAAGELHWLRPGSYPAQDSQTDDDDRRDRDQEDAAQVHASFLPARTSRSMGSRRRRLPVAAKMALARAGGPATVPVSPMAPRASPLGITCTSMGGVSSIRSIR